MPKKIIIITTLIAVIISIGAVGTYLALKQENKETEIEQPVTTSLEKQSISPEKTPFLEKRAPGNIKWRDPDLSESKPTDTTGWNIYRNDKFKFELRYPEGWEIRDRTYQDCTYEAESREGNCVFALEIASGAPTALVVIEVYENTKRLSLIDYLHTFRSFEEIRKYKESFSVSEVEIGEEKGVRIITYYGPETPYRSDTLYFSKNEFIYALSLPGYPQGPEVDELVNQIIYTFSIVP